MFNRIVYTVALLLVSASTLFAGNKNRTGEAGATELLIPVSARNLALNNSYLSMLSGIDGVEVNPASLGLMPQNQLYFSSLNYLADIKMNYLAAGFNFGDAGNFGFNVRSLDFGDITRTTNDNIYGTGESFSPTYVTIGVVYGKELTENIQFGVQLKYVHEAFYNVNAGGLGIDIGFQYSGVSILPGLNFGIALKNINLNKMEFQGQGLTIATNKTPDGALPNSAGKTYRVPTQAFDMPTSFEFGLSYSLIKSDNIGWSFSTAYQNNNISTDNFNFGSEVVYNNMLFLRGGYRYEPESIDSPFGPTFGVGLAYNLGFDFEFDYAYRTVNYFPSANQMLSFKIKL